MLAEHKKQKKMLKNRVCFLLCVLKSHKKSKVIANCRRGSFCVSELFFSLGSKFSIAPRDFTERAQDFTFRFRTSV